MAANSRPSSVACSTYDCGAPAPAIEIPFAGASQGGGCDARKQWTKMPRTDEWLMVSDQIGVPLGTVSAPALRGTVVRVPGHSTGESPMRPPSPHAQHGCRVGVGSTL